MAFEWVKEIYLPGSRPFCIAPGLSLGCSETIVITIIENKVATFRFIVVATHDVNIEDVVEPTTLNNRSFLGAK